MSTQAKVSNRFTVALRVVGSVLVAAGVIRFFQIAGFVHRFDESGDYVLVHFRSPTILTLSGLGLLVLSLVVPRIRR